MAPPYPLHPPPSCIYLYDISRVCQWVFFSDFGCLIFSPICSRRCEVVCWWLNLSPSSFSWAYPYSPYSLRLSFCFHLLLTLALCGLFCGLLSLIGSVCPLFSHICVFHVFLLLIFIIICSCLLLLIFAYVMQQATASNSSRRYEADCFSDYAEAQLKLIELTFSLNEKGEKTLEILWVNSWNMNVYLSLINCPKYWGYIWIGILWIKQIQ